MKEKSFGLFGVDSTSETPFFSDLHKENITISGIFADFFLLDLDNTIDDAFSQKDLDSDNYDALYNEAINNGNLKRGGRIYTPYIRIPVAYTVPEWFQDLKECGISEVEEEIELDVSIAEMHNKLQEMVFVCIFELINDNPNTNYKLVKTDTKLQLLETDNDLVQEWDLKENTIDDFLNYFVESPYFFINIIHTKHDTPLEKIILTQEIPIEYLEKNNFSIIDGDFDGVFKQNNLKMGDIFRTHTNKFYEITSIQASSMKIYQYVSLKIKATRVNLQNIFLPYQDYTEMLYDRNQDHIM